MGNSVFRDHGSNQQDGVIQEKVSVLATSIAVELAKHPNQTTEIFSADQISVQHLFSFLGRIHAHDIKLTTDPPENEPAIPVANATTVLDPNMISNSVPSVEQNPISSHSEIHSNPNPVNLANENQKEIGSVRRSARCKISPWQHRERWQADLRSFKSEGLEKRKTAEKGFGVFATKHFCVNEFVVEYVGENIPCQEGDLRFQSYPQERGSYMYLLDKKRGWIDATSESYGEYIGRYINHLSKSPNLSTRVVQDQNNKWRLFFVAIRDININDELSYDYYDRSKESLEAFSWLAT